MNRRNFLKGLVTAAAGFAILPGAGRIWKAEAKVAPVRIWAVPNPDYVDAPYEMRFAYSTRNGPPKEWFLDPVWMDRPGATINSMPIRFRTPDVDLRDPEAIRRASIPPMILQEVVDQNGTWK